MKVLAIESSAGPASCALTEDGRILAAGRRDDLPVDSGCRKVDLEGHAMLPAFLCSMPLSLLWLHFFG